MAHKADSDTAFQVFGANFSKGSMKNLVTDKQSPITYLEITIDDFYQ